jgi:hypothetical protein
MREIIEVNIGTGGWGIEKRKWSGESVRARLNEVRGDGKRIKRHGTIDEETGGQPMKKRYSHFFRRGEK